MKQKIGQNAGLVWNALNSANAAVEIKALKKATKLTDKDMFAAFGWLLREEKIAISEEGKEMFVSLV